MKPSRIYSKRISTPLTALCLALTLALAGCGGEQQQNGSAGSGEEAASGSSGGTTTESTTERTAPESTAAMGSTTMESTAMESTSGEQSASGGDGLTTALGSLDEARAEAESWNEDAELYAITVLRPNVNAEGENGSWLYSFVSESSGAVISVPYQNGQIREPREQQLPEQQISAIASDTLPVDKLIDSPEAIQRSEEVQNYLQENPDAGISASVDSASGDKPEWILIVPQERMQELVPALK